MTTNPPENFERLRQLSAQLYAATMISAAEDFPLWHPEVRAPYMCLVTDMSREVRDTVQRIADVSPPRCFGRKRQKRRRCQGY